MSGGGLNLAIAIGFRWSTDILQRIIPLRRRTLHIAPAFVSLSQLEAGHGEWPAILHLSFPLG
jgi:hypothetical protein